MQMHAFISAADFAKFPRGLPVSRKCFTQPGQAVTLRATFDSRRAICILRNRKRRVMPNESGNALICASKKA